MKKLLQSGFLVFALCFFWASTYGSEALEQRIKYSSWPKYANGPNIAALTGPQKILKGFNEVTGSQIIIRYPGGAAGQEWAEQMRDWFVAYGVPLKFLRLEIGSGAADELLLIRISP